MYRLKTFAGNQLPTRMLEEAFGAADVRPAYVDIADRLVFDADGARKAPRGTHTIYRRCIISAGNAEDAHKEYAIWHALVGRRDRLVRETLPTGELHWIYARLDALEAEHTPNHFNRAYIPVEFRWSILPPVVWNGNVGGGMNLWDGTGQWNTSGWKFNDGVGEVELTSNPQSLAVTNQGDTNVDNAVVTLTAGSADISNISFWCSSGASWYYEDTVVSGKTLVIDCGARSVKNNNVDAWDNFQINPGHRGRPWLRLLPGENTIIVTVGGISPGADAINSTLLVEFRHGWA